MLTPTITELCTKIKALDQDMVVLTWSIEETLAYTGSVILPKAEAVQFLQTNDGEPDAEDLRRYLLDARDGEWLESTSGELREVNWIDLDAELPKTDTTI